MSGFTWTHRDGKVPAKAHISRDSLHAEYVDPIAAGCEAGKKAAAIEISVCLRNQIASLGELQRALLEAPPLLGRQLFPFCGWVDFDQIGIDSLDAFRRHANELADCFLVVGLRFIEFLRIGC